MHFHFLLYLRRLRCYSSSAERGKGSSSVCSLSHVLYYMTNCDRHVTHDIMTPLLGDKPFSPYSLRKERHLLLIDFLHRSLVAGLSGWGWGPVLGSRAPQKTLCRPPLGSTMRVQDLVPVRKTWTRCSSTLQQQFIRAKSLL